MLPGSQWQASTRRCVYWMYYRSYHGCCFWIISKFTALCCFFCFCFILMLWRGLYIQPFGNFGNNWCGDCALDRVLSCVVCLHVGFPTYNSSRCTSADSPHLNPNPSTNAVKPRMSPSFRISHTATGLLKLRVTKRPRQNADVRICGFFGRENDET